jgi:HAD superfamily hydrolase (TIGR01509 family)
MWQARKRADGFQPPNGISSFPASSFNPHPPVSGFLMRHIIFDMDGTLLDTERLAEEAWAEASATVGVHFPEAFYPELIGRAAPDTQRLMAEAISHPERLEDFRGAWDRVYERFLAEGQLALRPGVRKTLETLQARGIGLSVATSTGSVAARRKLALMELRAFFPLITTGDEVRHSKPAPDIFQLALQRAEVRPDQCLVVEDSPNGVRAATAAGLRTILIPDRAPIPPDVSAMAWRVFDRIDALLGLPEVLGA